MKPTAVRIDVELLERIDTIAKRVGMKRSTFIRYVLSRAVGIPAIEAGLTQEVYELQAVLQPVMQDLYRDFVEQARQRFGEALGIEPASVVEVEPVRALGPGDVPRALPAEGGVEGVHGRPVRGRRKRGATT